MQKLYLFMQIWE